MHSYLPDLAGRSVPRYTSYPTAAEFTQEVGAVEQGAALEAIAPNAPVSLYVHVPYCREICWYCGCNTGAVGRESRLHAYLDALGAEIDAVASRMRGEVIAIHFGGGSPNSLPPEAFAALVAQLRERFTIADAPEMAVELDPRGLDGRYAETLAATGVTRVSLGAQTFAAHVQRRINRIQPYALVEQVVADLRAAGIAHVNLDLMYGLPGQSGSDLEETIRLALDLAPDRIAMFGYAHMPRLLPRQRMIDEASLPGAEARFGQSALAHDLLTAAGYSAVGFDHFARPEDSLAVASAQGRLRRNFQGFTVERADAIVGLGASAISQFPGLIVQNEKHVGRYKLRVRNGALAGVRGVARMAEDRLRGSVIERLLCDGAVDVAAVAQAHGQPVERLAASLAALKGYAAHRLVAVEGWRCVILKAGRPYARLVAATFDTHRGGEASFSRAV